MISISAIQPQGERRTPEAKHALAMAYRSLFMSGDENAQIVLSDLVDYCSYYSVCATEVSEGVLRDHNARRAVFGRIFHFLNLSPSEMNELANAGRREAVTNKEEGYL